VRSLFLSNTKFKFFIFTTTAILIAFLFINSIFIYLGELEESEVMDVLFKITTTVLIIFDFSLLLSYLITYVALLISFKQLPK
jgi:hypothetical protein